MLQVIFGDDEHTAADGPYARIMKTRKWLYLSSISALAISHGLYNEEAAFETLKFIRVPYFVLKPALSIGVVYLLLQYILLVLQLVATYDITLAERFTFRRADELASARERLKVSRREHAESVDAFSKNAFAALARRSIELEKDLVSVTEERQSAIESRKMAEASGLPARELQQRRHHEGRTQAQYALAKARFDEVAKDPEAAMSRMEARSDPDVQIALESVFEAEEVLASLQKQVPSERAGYKIFERLIDLSRVAPPLLLAVYALPHLAFT